MGNLFHIDLHTHTCASGHGTADTITDMAKAAASKKIMLLGISDHGPATSGAAGLNYFRSLPLGERKRFGVSMLYGAEANILDNEGHLDIPADMLKALDYVIISMHSPIYSPGSVKENTLAYERAMEHPNVRIIGHCDDSRFPVDYPLLVKAAAKRNIVPELNNVSLQPDSYRKNCRRNAVRLLTACMEEGRPILLSSDSHGSRYIGDMTLAWELARQRAFPESLIGNFHPKSLLMPLFQNLLQHSSSGL